MGGMVVPQALHLFAVIFYLLCFGKWPTLFLVSLSLVVLVPKISKLYYTILCYVLHRLASHYMLP
jgi:hypothetical protein